MCNDHDVTVSVKFLHQLKMLKAETRDDDYLLLFRVPAITKVHGAHLKASAAMVRLRLYDILALLPPKTYEGKTVAFKLFCANVADVFLRNCFKLCNVFAGSFNALLRELVAEFTLTDNSANTTTSLLRSLCHYDDSVLMGSWLQETDHKSIEDQVSSDYLWHSSKIPHLLTWKSTNTLFLGLGDIA